MTEATKRYYAGIGSRETPHDVCLQMKDFASELSRQDFILRSGHSDGADIAFENGSCASKQEIFLPWLGFNSNTLDTPASAQIILGHENQAKFEAIAQKHHGNWGICNPAAKKLLTRNVPVILGLDLKTPVEFVISWSVGPGGTAHTTAIAQSYGIPVFNLAKPNGLKDLLDFAKTL